MLGVCLFCIEECNKLISGVVDNVGDIGCGVLGIFVLMLWEVFICLNGKSGGLGEFCGVFEM